MNRAEPRLDPPSESTPPKGLDAAGAAEWTRLYKPLVEAGVLTCGDLAVFEEYCFVRAELNRFKRLAKRCSGEQVIAKGILKATVTLRQQLRQLAGDIGLTPASRSGVKASGEQKKSQSSKDTSSRSSKPAPDEATAYAEAVRDGQIITGKPVRLAWLRHLEDISRQSETGLQWRPDLAQHVFGFFRDNLTIETKGAILPFKLQPFQKFIIGSLFGWLNADDTRRFRNAFIEIGKGNGKTPLAAGIGLYGLIADGEQSPEIYSAATASDQAKILWKDASTMVSRNPELREIIEDRVASLFNPALNGIFRPVSSEHCGLDGKCVHMALIDEVHEHPTPLVVEKMRAGTKTRRNALIFEITNSGSDLETICRKHHDYSLSVVEGVIDDPSWFAYVCSLDDGDDWMGDESCWIKANPGLGSILPIEYLREQVREARGMPTKQNMVARLNFCVWTQQGTLWIPMQSWDENDHPVTAKNGQACWIGIDLSTKHDLTCVALVFKQEVDAPLDVEIETTSDAQGETQKKNLNLSYAVDIIPYFFIPEETMHEAERLDRVPYSLWAREGFVFPTPGPTVDYNRIYDMIVNQIAPKCSIQEIGFDPFNATEFAGNLQKAGFRVVEVRQGVQTMSEPSKRPQTSLAGGDSRKRDSWHLPKGLGEIVRPAPNKRNFF